MRGAGGRDVGTVLQAYLYRTEADTERLLKAGDSHPAVQGRVQGGAGRGVSGEGGCGCELREADEADGELVGERGLLRDCDAR